jgi:hypothetical protein
MKKKKVVSPSLQKKEKSPKVADWTKLMIPLRSIKNKNDPQEILLELRYGSMSS